MLENKKVFVSGGAGVIGTALVEKLLRAGANVIVGDLKPRPVDWDDRIVYRQGDLNEITKEELEWYEPEYFFHLAATFERSTETYEFWEENFSHNLRLSHHLMTCLKDSPTLRRVVFASSYLIYDQKQYTFDQPADRPVSLQESDTISPRNLCGAAKLVHEVELDFLNHFNEGRFTTVCPRIFRSYGKHSRDVISRWIRMLLNGETLTVYKKEGIFDYVYAEDVAEGLIRLAESPATGIVNLGSGRSRRVSEVIEVLRQHFPDLRTVDSDLPIPFEASQADMTRFREWTNWLPEHRLEDAIPKMIAFERGRMDRDEQHESVKPIHVLVTSISKKIPLLKMVRRGLNKMGPDSKLYGADLDPDCIGRYFVDEFWEMPRITELSVEDLLDYCRERGITAIIPTRDGELAFFAEHKTTLESHGIGVMVSPLPTVKSCLDKLEFYRKMNAAGFPAIPASEVMESESAGLWVVKERYGAGSAGVGLRLTPDEASEHAARLSHPIYQPYVHGREYSIDLYRDLSGHTKGVVTRTRDTVVGGESQVTTTVRLPELERLCAEMAESLGIYGHAVLQVIEDEAGRFHVVECNSRIGGASRLSMEAGLDSLYWFFLETKGVRLEPYPFARSLQEKRLIRYAEDRIECL
ncbi:NAD-dependent epimerase/dehydratase family protein [Cohnella caldifontis]|uniref:NAD-dependent epimerase/dehydratase family protein n=1 Tax=Cohnella caldifontis TaxID=3027471 RepID=UPI0023ED2368|nr:NAD-dependent epimerase/dehydratase family protein [Cohnella sp. YIM B05605]